MTDRPAIPELISESRVIAIGRNIPAAAAPRIGEALVAGGVHVMELTLNEPEADALAAIAALADAADELGALGGRRDRAIDRRREAGCRCRRPLHRLPPHRSWPRRLVCVAWCALLPGRPLADRVLAVWNAGASAVKLFPAAAVGPAYLKLIAGPFPEIPFVPTGGVSAQNTGDWMAAGAVAVGMGGWLIGDGNPAGVTERARLVRQAVDGAAHERST